MYFLLYFVVFLTYSFLLFVVLLHLLCLCEVSLSVGTVDDKYNVSLLLFLLINSFFVAMSDVGVVA